MSMKFGWIPAPTAVWFAAALVASGVEPGPGLNTRDDAGTAAYSTGVGVPAGELVPAQLAGEFPVAQQARMVVLGGAVRGFGMLAQYAQPGTRRVIVARRTRQPGHEPFTPVALASVFDPDGNLAAVEDFTGQTEETAYRVMEIKDAKAGIWRVSFSGGRSGDLVEIGLPATPVWGVRGEMALGVTPDTPRRAYLWIPPSAKKLLLGVEAGPAQGIAIQDEAGNRNLATPETDPTKRVARLVLDPAPAGTVCQVALPSGFAGALVIEGAPGLLCPSANAARALTGGAVESHGRWVGGPLQARARDWMVAQAASLNRAPMLAFPPALPPALESPQLQVLAFGKYGPLNNLDWMVSEQNKHLDPSDPSFGGMIDPDSEDPDHATWINFVPAHPASIWEAPALAAAAAFDSPLNPAYRNRDVVRRATLAAFSNFASMQGDDLLRELNLFAGRYPLKHAFFVYSASAEAFLSLQDQLPEEEKAIWRQGLLAVGDKAADFQGYESNQWAHMMRGHLAVYLATGEKRFLRYFEREMTAYLDDAFGPNAKFGQHPAGFFLEEFGADGNYDKLNSYCVVSSYNDYKILPEADPVLVEKLRQGIAADLRFSSFFWLRQPDGEIHSPNAFNCRRPAMLGAGGYPGVWLAKREFALAAARAALTTPPAKGVGEAGTLSFVANTDAWIHRVLEWGLAKGPGGFQGPNGGWLPALVKAYARPQTVEPAVLPCDAGNATWTLPGLLAWKRGALYGVDFYDVAGADHELNALMGGGPTVLWTQATGSFLASTQPGEPPDSNHITSPNLLTFSCVYGTDSHGAFFYTGKERSELKTVEEAKQYEIDADLFHSFALLGWTYTLANDGVDLSVALRAHTPPKEAWLNLPLLLRLKDATAALASPNSLVFAANGARVVFDWPADAPGQLAESSASTIKRLVIPLPADGKPLVLHIHSRPGP
jgi:hypothetical protein